MTRVPPPAQASALAICAAARLLRRIDADRKKQDALMSFP
jgi:hypothetical protein